MTRTLAVVLGTVMLLACVTEPLCASGKKRDRSAVLEVPTTGKIIDVTYQAGFDEWWVKCREGDSVSVYSYDARTREWGKVLFVPKKIADKEKAGHKPSPSSDTDKEKGVAVPQAVEEPKAEHIKDPSKAGGKPDAKWWDPFKIMKQGEKLIRKPWTEEGK